MKIFCYALCYNEEFLLPHFLKHYSSFCDKIIIYDDNSTDRSREIIESFEKAVWFEYPYGDKINDGYFTELKNNCWKTWKNDCDYSIVVDIDEFLYHPNIVEFLENNQQFTIFKPQGYNMVGDEIPDSDVSLFEQINCGAEDLNFSKCCIFNPKEIVDINYEPGCHKCNPSGNIVMNDYNLKLLHYRFLSCDYNIQRNIDKRDRMSQHNKQFNLGFHVYFDNQKMIDEYNDIKKRSIKVF